MWNCIRELNVKETDHSVFGLTISDWTVLTPDVEMETVLSPYTRQCVHVHDVYVGSISLPFSTFFPF